MAFIEVEEGYTIQFEGGTYDFTNTLSMDGKTNIVIKGAGREVTYLDFSGQTAGGEGVLVTNSSNIRFENLSIIDATGDALKARDCDRISFVGVGTIWSGTPDAGNGAYGLYPVLCTEVYIDNCYAYGASDAGIYVGQSDKVIVKNSLAEGNVAGIEIENTTNADVFDNEATDNTGGILVFDLPGLTQYGSHVRVFNNNVYDNNRANFAPSGNIVGNVPAGTGCMILSTNTVEIFNNSLSENDFAGILVASYLIINDTPNDPNFQPLPYSIFIHDNSHTMTGTISAANQPSLVADIINLLVSNNLDQPNILLDGLILLPTAVCVQEDAGTSFVNMNALNDMSFQSIITDISVHDCTQTPLSAVEFDPF
ncbi:MAG: right-handed parallel beta-helix repeat-containing protein [Chitinophagales bacterium]|nr:right-handed parallel beta-helix repeat-containing protein [Chitinophagales bacterium]